MTPTSNSQPKDEDIAPLLRLGLEEPDSAALTLDATIRVNAPTPHAGSGGTGGGRRWSPPSVEALQHALPQYEISALVACGGMGAVYKGQQKTLKRAVAIKVMPPEIDDGSDMHFAERFKREAQAMAQLSHPNIVAVFDAGETPEGLLYFVMEFIEGTDVAQLIVSEGKLSTESAAHIITAVCEALSFAHEEGIVHRDIKPSNIMIDKRGRVKVADFGLAKVTNLSATAVTRSHVAMGTPDFIAPEAMIPGISVDGRADLYAVGVMLYQMLTGHIPRGRFALPSGVVPQVDSGFDAIVDKAMQTDRDKRYSTATELKTDVESLTQGVSKKEWPKEGHANTPVSSPIRGGAAAQHIEQAASSVRAPLLIGIAVALVVGFGAWLLMNKPSKKEAQEASTSAASVGITPASPAPTAIKAESTPVGNRSSADFRKDFPTMTNAEFTDALATAKTPGGLSPSDRPAMGTPRAPEAKVNVYAVGQWVRPFGTLSDLNTNWSQGGTTWQDGWITPGAGTNEAITLAAPNGHGRNWGVRARYLWQEKGTASLSLRRGGKAADKSVSAYDFRVNSNQAYFRRTQGNGEGADANVTALGQSVPLNLVAGSEVLIEAFAIGSMLYGRANGQLFEVASDGVLEAGNFEAAALQISYRDVEFINLDGLSEEEARKAAGIER